MNETELIAMMTSNGLSAEHLAEAQRVTALFTFPNEKMRLDHLRNRAFGLHTGQIPFTKR